MITPEPVAIIGGSGIETNRVFADFKPRIVATPHGKARLRQGKLAGRTVVFLPRHGIRHDVAPHRINYRANIKALQKIGVGMIVATAAVGSIDPRLKPGDLAVLDDFIDFTRSREPTFFDRRKVVHTDLSAPYNERLNRCLIAAVKHVAGKTPPRTVYVATEGPRFETRAEIRMFKTLGAGVVGMTGCPEVVLANELAIPYATLALVTNYACGVGKGKIEHDAFMAVMAAADECLAGVILNLIERLPATLGRS